MPTVHRNNKRHTIHDYSMFTDAELIPLVENDVSAFSELYERYYHRVFYYLLNLVKNPADSEDLTSQTFLSAFTSLNKLKRKQSFSSWLFRIARNKAYDLFRRQRKTQEIPTEFIEELDAELFSGSKYKKEDIVIVRKIVNLLSTKEAELLQLRLVAELTFLEIAEVLGESVNKVKKDYYKILRFISTEFKDQNENK